MTPGGGNTQPLSPHVSECYHAGTHVRRQQIARRVERFVVGAVSESSSVSYGGVGGCAGVDDECEVVLRLLLRRVGADADAVRHGERGQVLLLDAAA